MPQPERLIAFIGDIHGRFLRVSDWLEQLEKSLGRPLDAVFAVGDVEAFVSAEDHRRKATKRQLPAEYAEIAAGRARLGRPIHFIGGNNEDFETLHPLPSGGELAGGLVYLGRAGVRQVSGLQVAFLSGIYAPKHFDTPLEPPRTRELAKRAGYFRKSELAALQGVSKVDLLLLHEWPKGLVRPRPGGRRLRAHRFPWLGNPIARALLDSVRPTWCVCGHAHVPYASSIRWPDGRVTRVSCLDQASQPESSVFWLAWDQKVPTRAGWGVTGRVDWTAGQKWDETCVPEGAETGNGATM